MFVSTANRVPANTAEHLNAQIQCQCLGRVARIAAGGRKAIDRRLRELDEEWDIERAIETLAPSFTLLGVGLGVLVNRRWLALPALVNAFLLQHALQGWCPPIPVLRRLGFRTMREIDSERCALKVLSGDFKHVPTGSRNRPLDVSEALAAAEC